MCLDVSQARLDKGINLSLYLNVNPLSSNKPYYATPLYVVNIYCPNSYPT